MKFRLKSSSVDQTDADSEPGREVDVVNETTHPSTTPISQPVPIRVKVVDTETYVEAMRPYTIYVIMTTRKVGGEIGTDGREYS